MTDFYKKASEITAGSTASRNKGFFIKAGLTASVVTAHVYGSLPGTTADLEVAVPADESMIVPIEIQAYHTGTNSPKVYKLN